MNGVDVTAHLHDDRVAKNVAQVSAIVPLRHYVKIWLEDKFDYEPLEDNLVEWSRIDESAMKVEED